MAVPAAPNNLSPISHAGAGIHHRIVSAPAAVVRTPSFYSPLPLASVLASGTASATYSETLIASGGTSPYTFSISAGSLPTGLTLSSGGVISGIPTATGTFTFSVQVVDSNGYTGAQSFSMTIATASSSGGTNYGFVA